MDMHDASKSCGQVYWQYLKLKLCHQIQSGYKVILMYRQYELQQRQPNQFAAPLITEEPVDIIVPNQLRNCTDVVCAIILVIFIGAFAVLLGYGGVKGTPTSIIAIYNAQGVRCNNRTDFKFGYLSDSSILRDAVCLASCPTATGQQVSCLPDGVNCPASGLFAAPYASFVLETYCLPSVLGNNVNIQSLFNLNVFQEWTYDLQQGYIVLILAAVAGVVLSLFFFAFVRCCAGPIIWMAIFVCIAGMMTIGVFFILQAKGITVADFVSQQLSTISYDTLIIVGSCLIGGSVLLSLLAFCLRSRIAMGVKAVQLGSLFLLQNCGLAILPVTQVILVAATVAAIIFGAASIYSLGEFAFPQRDAFPFVYLSPGQVVMLVVFLVGGLWLVFYFHGCNHFMLCSAVSVWYFNQLNQSGGAPCGDSLWRLVRYHPGSVAITSLLNGLLFAVKLLATIFSFDARDDDSALVNCCLKCLNALFCIFRCFLRFLNEGTYVQIAITAQGYCSSTMRAYDLLADNILKIGITDGISIFFTFLGVLGISVGVAVAAYFSVLYIPYYRERISSPLIITVVSGILSFIISAIYLSMIDVSATSVLQCYLVDHEAGNGKIRHANDRIREIMTDE